MARIEAAVEGAIRAIEEIIAKDRWFGGITLYEVLRPLLVGVVHGLAGSAAIALLVVSTIQSYRWAVAYLVIFGVGTILGMVLITITIASTFSIGQKRFANIGRHFGRQAAWSAYVRPLCCLPGRIHQRAVHRPRAVDTALTPRRLPQ